MTALVHFELASCYQELGEYENALNYYYSSLPQHSNPKLVQEKIERVRKRLRASQGRSSIYSPSAFKPIRRKSKTAKQKPGAPSNTTKPKKTPTKRPDSSPKPSKKASKSNNREPNQASADPAPAPSTPAPAPAPPKPKPKKVETKPAPPKPAPKKPTNSPTSTPSGEKNTSQ